MNLEQQTRVVIAAVTLATTAGLVMSMRKERATRIDRLFTILTILFTVIYAGGLLLREEVICVLAFVPTLILGTITSHCMIRKTYSGFPAFRAVGICGIIIFFCLLFGLLNTFGE